MIPIIFVRYAPGACGTFLLTLLQTCNKVACWNTILDSYKQTDEFDNIFYNWFITKFTHDLYGHVTHEPHHPYKLDFFSSKHPRGNDITEQEFVNLLKQNNDQLFLDNIQQQKYTAMRLNKGVIPLFASDSKVINIVIDSSSEKWLNRTRWVKLFGKEKETFIAKEEHPDYLKYKFDLQNLKFFNQYEFKDTWHGFIKNKVINDATVLTFKNKNTITKDASNSTADNFFINLSNLIDKQVGVETIIDSFKHFGLDINQNLIKACYDHYYTTNIVPFLK